MLCCHPALCFCYRFQRFVSSEQFACIRASKSGPGEICIVSELLITAIRSMFDVWMIFQTILEVDNWMLFAKKQKRLLVTKHTYFTRCHKITAQVLIVGALTSVSAPRSAVRISVQCFFIKQFRDKFESGGFIAAQV